MHDLKDIRSKPDYYKEKLSKRNKELVTLLEEILTIDQKKREVQTKAD